MNSIGRYFSNFFKALKSLLIGMKTTLKIFFRKKTTECYPENRKKNLYISPLYRGCLEMIHTAGNHHHCVACGICQMNCPNGTIKVESEMVTDAEGKKTKVLKAYTYDLGRCMFCELCVRTCPHHAIQFTNQFENAVFTRSKLILTLNHPGSSLQPKAAAPKPATAPAISATAATAASTASPKATPQAEAPAKAEASVAKAPGDAEAEATLATTGNATEPASAQHKEPANVG